MTIINELQEEVKPLNESDFKEDQALLSKIKQNLGA